MVKSKKLTVSMIRDEANKFNETTTLTLVKNDKEIDVIIYPYFSNDRITNLFEKLKDDLEGLNKYKITLKDNLVIPFVLHHTILEFTNIGRLSKQRYKNEEDYYKASIQYFQQLYSTSYFDEIVESFLGEELTKIFKKVNDVLLANDKLNQINAKMQQQIQNLDLKNPELQKRIQGKQIPEA